METYRIDKVRFSKRTGELVENLVNVNDGEDKLTVVWRPYIDYFDEVILEGNECAADVEQIIVDDQNCVLWEDWETNELFVSPAERKI